MPGLLSRFFSSARNVLPQRSTVTRAATRLGVGGAYLGGGYLASALIESRERSDRAFYGNRAYESMYGDSMQLLGSMARGAGWVGGILGVMGRDPVSGLVRDVGVLSRRVSTRISTMGAGRRYSLAKANLRKAVQRGAGPIGLIPSNRQYLLREQKRLGRTGGYRREFEEYSRARDIFKQRRAVLEGPRPRLISGKNLMKGAAVVGLTSLTSSVSGGAVATTLGVGAGAAFTATGAPFYLARSVIRHPGVWGGGAASLGAGAALGAKMPMYASAEGRITSFRTEEQSTVRKMNFSTAGLLQSIHNGSRTLNATRY